jgi:hypothetical protein
VDPSAARVCFIDVIFVDEYAKASLRSRSQTLLDVKPEQTVKTEQGGMKFFIFKNYLLKCSLLRQSSLKQNKVPNYLPYLMTV